MEKCSKKKKSFEEENAVKNEYFEKYKDLINRYYEFASDKDHEAVVQHMYLDSPGGYPTIGCGHLLYTKLEGKNARALIQKLSDRIPSDFPCSIDYPHKVTEYLSISDDELIKVYDDQDILFGLLSLQSMELQESSGSVDGKTVKFGITRSLKEKSTYEKDTLIIRAYNEILSLAIMSKARAKKFGCKANKFGDWRFYTTPRGDIPGCNNLIILVGDAQELAKKDMVKKIKELIHPISLTPFKPSFPDFESYPLPAQLALLELTYNGGVNGLITGNPDYYQLIIDQDWEALSDPKRLPILSRRIDAYEKRNQKVRDWFADAAKVKAVQNPASSAYK